MTSELYPSPRFIPPCWQSRKSSQSSSAGWSHHTDDRHHTGKQRPRRSGLSDGVLAQTPELADRGRSLFSTACSRCHGVEGVGGGTGGAVPPMRNYDGGWEKFSRVVTNGRKNTAMGGFKGILTEDDARALRISHHASATVRPLPEPR
jgi:Cytochrome C oxidase, cbb3-type, subunit III